MVLGTLNQHLCSLCWSERSKSGVSSLSKHLCLTTDTGYKEPFEKMQAECFVHCRLLMISSVGVCVYFGELSVSNQGVLITLSDFHSKSPETPSNVDTGPLKYTRIGLGQQCIFSFDSTAQYSVI